MVQRTYKSKQKKILSKSKISTVYQASSENRIKVKEKGLILLDQRVIRKQALGKCQKTLKKIDKAKTEIDQYEKVDKPAYEHWIGENFGELIAKIRSSSLEIQGKRAFIEEVQEEAFFKRITFIEAYKIIKYRKEHPEEFEKPKKDTEQENHWHKKNEEKDEEDFFREDLNDFFKKFHSKFNMNEEEFESFRRNRKGNDKDIDFDVRLKERYRLIVHKLHPDKNKKPSTMEKELWHEAQEAYRQRDLEKLDFIIALYNIRFGSIGIDSSIFDLKFANSKLEKSLKQFSSIIRKAKNEPSWLFLKLKPSKLDAMKKQASKEFKEFEKITSLELKEINSIISKWENASVHKLNKESSKDYRKQKEKEYLNFYTNF